MGIDAPQTASRAVGPVVVGVLAFLVHLVPGYLMLVSGLSVPIWAVALMLVAWLGLTLLLVRLVRRRSWWTPVVPVAALALWVAVLTAGEWLFGWTA